MERIEILNNLVDVCFTDEILLNVSNICLIEFNYVTKLKNNNLKKTNEEFISKYFIQIQPPISKNQHSIMFTFQVIHTTIQTYSRTYSHHNQYEIYQINKIYHLYTFTLNLN